MRCNNFTATGRHSNQFALLQVQLGNLFALAPASNDMKRWWQAGDSALLTAKHSAVSVHIFLSRRSLTILDCIFFARHTWRDQFAWRGVTGKMHLVNLIFPVRSHSPHVLEHAPRAGINNWAQPEWLVALLKFTFGNWIACWFCGTMTTHNFCPRRFENVNLYVILSNRLHSLDKCFLHLTLAICWWWYQVPIDKMRFALYILNCLNLILAIYYF